MGKTTDCNCGKYRQDAFRHRSCQFWHSDPIVGSRAKCQGEAVLLAHVYGKSVSQIYYVESCETCNHQHEQKMWVPNSSRVPINCTCGRSRLEDQLESCPSAPVPWERPGKRYHPKPREVSYSYDLKPREVNYSNEIDDLAAQMKQMTVKTSGNSCRVCRSNPCTSGSTRCRDCYEHDKDLCRVCNRRPNLGAGVSSRCKHCIACGRA